MENVNDTSALLARLTTYIEAKEKEQGSKRAELVRSPEEEVVIEAPKAQEPRAQAQAQQIEPVKKVSMPKISNKVNFCICMASLSVMITLLLIALMPKIRPGAVLPLFVMVGATFTTIMYIMKYKYK